MLPAGATDDSLDRGALHFAQPHDGFRSGDDATWLAAFTETGTRARRGVDLGAGAGAVVLRLAVRFPEVTWTAVERDPDALACLRHNVAANGLDSRIEVVACDAEEFGRARGPGFDVVVCNPPFFAADSVRPSRSPALDAARADDEGPARMLRTARQRLGNAGRASFIVPAGQLETVLRAAGDAGLHAKRLTLVHPSPQRPATRALIEFRAGRPGGLLVSPPWIVPVPSPAPADHAAPLQSPAASVLSIRP